MPSPNNTEELQKLARLLRGKFLTAAAIAKKSNCARSIVARRLTRLQEHGCELVTKQVREGKSGPVSAAYSIIDNKTLHKFLDGLWYGLK
jgi:predicted transcriptional regulator